MEHHFAPARARAPADPAPPGVEASATRLGVGIAGGLEELAHGHGATAAFKYTEVTEPPLKPFLSNRAITTIGGTGAIFIHPRQRAGF